jgi:hypothetical protein
MQMRVKVAGFKGVDQALAQLPKATGKNVLRRVGRPPMEEMANVAAQKAPERTGRLAFSISVSEKRTRRAQTGFKSSSGLQLAMGPAGGFGGTLEYASFDEFGTVDTPAFGYMRYAWDTRAQPTLDYLEQNLWAEIERAAQRISNKRARVGG